MVSLTKQSVTLHSVISASPSHGQPRSGGPVSVRALEVAMEQTEYYLKTRDHEDIDLMDNVRMPGEKVKETFITLSLAW